MRLLSQDNWTLLSALSLNVSHLEATSAALKSAPETNMSVSTSRGSAETEDVPQFKVFKLEDLFLFDM